MAGHLLTIKNKQFPVELPRMAIANTVASTATLTLSKGRRPQARE